MASDAKTIRILLVEDVVTVRKIALSMLRSIGHDAVLESANGREAADLLESGEPVDLIISDWNMPEMDGLELLKRVRASDAHRHIPFIMATAQADMAEEKKAADAGVSSFVGKPFDAAELESKIREAMAPSGAAEKTPAAAAPVVSAGKLKLNVAHIQITDHLIIGVLKHLIEKGEMRPRHFDLELVCMPGWNPVRDALARGKVGAACILGPIGMDLFRFDVPIRLILLAHRSGSIFVRNKKGDFSGIYSNFFRGKSFLIPHKLSIHHVLAHMFFRSIGLSPGVVGDPDTDVHFEVVDPIQMPGFLSGNPDAGGFLVAEPLGTKAIENGVADLQFLSSKLWKNHPCCIVAVREDVLSANEDAMYELADMLVRVGAFIENNREAVQNIAVSFLDPDGRLGLKPPMLDRVLKEPLGIKTGELYPVIEEFDKIQKYMVNDMGVGDFIDLETFIDARFADAARKKAT